MQLAISNLTQGLKSKDPRRESGINRLFVTVHILQYLLLLYNVQIGDHIRCEIGGRVQRAKREVNEDTANQS